MLVGETNSYILDCTDTASESPLSYSWNFRDFDESDGIGVYRFSSPSRELNLVPKTLKSHTRQKHVLTIGA